MPADEPPDREPPGSTDRGDPSTPTTPSDPPDSTDRDDPPGSTDRDDPPDSTDAQSDESAGPAAGGAGGGRTAGESAAAGGGGRDWRAVALGVALAGVAAAYLADVYVAGTYLVPAWEWAPTRSDWLFVASSWLLVALAVGVVRDRALARRYWARLRASPGALAGLGVLVAFAVVGLVGPLVVPQPTSNVAVGLQPPAFQSLPADSVVECLGRVVDDRCRGSLAHPLGMDRYGHDVLAAVVHGARLALYVAVVSAAIVVPLGTLVGATAGFYGGTVDTLLMRYVDVQQTIPAVVAYVVLVLVVEKSLFMLLLVFGIFSWGGVARVVRSETRQRRAAEYVLAGRSAGGTRPYLLRRHLLPNVSHGVVTALAHQIPLLLVTEAAIAYLDLNAVDQPSWGEFVAHGIDTAGTTVPITGRWWSSLFPVCALAGTVLATKLLGDALRDVLDPRDG
jgi:peptide/nickel transport system permease protein